MAGTGTHLKKIIVAWLGVNTGGCGNCQALLEEMDRRGPAWVRANIGTIAPRIRDNARKSKDWKARILSHLPGVRFPIRAMIRHAIRNAEADQKQQ